MIKHFVLSLAAVAAAATAHADPSPLPMTSPESVGFSSERLRTIDQFFEREIERNRVPGAVVAIARNGRLVYYKALGFRDKQKGTAMTTDTIFPLASMTKIMTAVGALTLTEKGQLPLDSPLADYYPDFANMKVGVEGAADKARWSRKNGRS